MPGAEVALFATLTTFGTPHDVTLDELSVELSLPNDAVTAAALRAAEDRQRQNGVGM